jgi:Alpha/beta hydrolase family
MAPKPTILVIPGSFTKPHFYDGMAAALRDSGYEVFVYAHLSSRRSLPEKGATMQEDAAYFRGIIEMLANDGKDVVAVTHSYGGVVGSEAAKGVIKSEREKEGKPGGLVRIVYVTSVVPAVGNSLLDQGGAPEWHPARTATV